MICFTKVARPISTQGGEKRQYQRVIAKSQTTDRYKSFLLSVMFREHSEYLIGNHLPQACGSYIIVSDNEVLHVLI